MSKAICSAEFCEVCDYKYSCGTDLESGQPCSKYKNSNAETIIKLQQENSTLKAKLKEFCNELNDWVGSKSCYASVYTITDDEYGELCYIRDKTELFLREPKGDK